MLSELQVSITDLFEIIKGFVMISASGSATREVINPELASQIQSVDYYLTGKFLSRVTF